MPRHTASYEAGRPAIDCHTFGTCAQGGDDRIAVLAHGGSVPCGRLLQPKAELPRVHGLGAEHVLDDRVAVPAPTTRTLSQGWRGLFAHQVPTPPRGGPQR